MMNPSRDSLPTAEEDKEKKKQGKEESKVGEKEGKNEHSTEFSGKRKGKREQPGEPSVRFHRLDITTSIQGHLMRACQKSRLDKLPSSGRRRSETFKS